MTKATLITVSANEPEEKILEILDRDGGIIIRQPEGSQLATFLNKEVGPVFDGSGFCKGSFYGAKTKRLYGLVAKSKACQKMAVNPVVLNIMQKVLGPYSYNKVLLNLTQGIEIHYGEREQALHRDDSMFGAHVKSHEYMINAMWAHTDFTKENGATLIVPGSHKWSQSEEELIGRILSLKEEDIATAEMEPGDVLVYYGSTVHAGGANRTSQPRRGIVLSYSVAWLRQAEPQLLAVPWAIAKDFPEELIDLLGYCAIEPNLGLYEGMHPKTALRLPKGQTAEVSDLLTPQQNELIEAYHSMKKAA